MNPLARVKTREDQQEALNAPGLAHVEICANLMDCLVKGVDRADRAGLKAACDTADSCARADRAVLVNGGQSLLQDDLCIRFDDLGIAGVWSTFGLYDSERHDEILT